MRKEKTLKLFPKHMESKVIETALLTELGYILMELRNF